jgi:hypothetical protein
VKLDLVFRQFDIDWLNFPIKVWSILSHDIGHIESGEGRAGDHNLRQGFCCGLCAKYAWASIPKSRNGVALLRR